MTEESGIALLGRRDAPTDAVEDYCLYLGEALRPLGFKMQIQRVNWFEQGWSSALLELRRQTENWDGRWALLQYTALAWSKRGFPLGFLRVLRELRKRKARVAVVFHDAGPHRGARVIDKLRKLVQTYVMNDALRICELGVFTVSVDRLTWVKRRAARTVAIPVGANLPEPEKLWKQRGSEPSQIPSIAVYGITSGESAVREAALIAQALEPAANQLGRLRLIAMGRNSNVAEDILRRSMKGLPVEICVTGILPAAEIVSHMAGCDLMLDVRGEISTRRGSAIAGIACGLPIVGFNGPDTAFPITEAGIVFAQEFNAKELGEGVLKVLSDRDYRAVLAEKSRRAQEKYFSWPAIAEQYAMALRATDSGKP
ncbi:MAG TPA: hypothetical protein VJN93_15730 [Candidatus Acidoferrum sp.]|nr:hypothetical protein [Candidatus Acidoferrum sp.]